MAKYAISDIHGCSKTFQALLKKINFNKEDELFLLGDYIDRGPDSRGVIQHILDLQEEGYILHCLRGNHEQMMIDTMDGSDRHANLWIRNGGEATLKSYFKVEKDIPDTHLLFLDRLPFFKKIEGYYLVHAGFNFSYPDPLKDTENMLWMRGWYGKVDRNWLGENIIVHGHTPTEKKILENQLKNTDQLPVINIDFGCVYDRRGQGWLGALDLEQQKFIFQSNIDRQ